MQALLLAVIYVTFISLGLPDSLLGAGWPVMHEALSVPLAYAGFVSMIVSCGTVLSSLMTDRLVRRFRSGRIVFCSVFGSALSLLGFSLAPNFAVLCLIAVPYGLSAGAIDAVLNNYVALHYSGKHMSWLHCFWGVGAAVSPYIMSLCLRMEFGWRSGYRTVFLIQAVIAAAVLLSLPLWKQNSEPSATGNAEKPLPMREVLSVRGVKPAMLSFFCYCGLEVTAGLWACSYLVEAKGVDATVAARFGALFYLGITLGRFACGWITDRLGDRNMSRLGCAVVLCGVTLMLIPIENGIFSLCGLILTGLGCAPIYPSNVHATPGCFGNRLSQSVIGLQMAAFNVGSVALSPLFGSVFGVIGIGFYPIVLLLFALPMPFLIERKFSVCRNGR